VLACPALALKVYVNPSIQTGNYSPDGAYNEGNQMQDVANRLMSKLQARGISCRNSGWLDLGPACSDCNSWGADCFVALHTDAASSGWSSAHGTRGFFHQSSSGWHDDRNVAFADCIVNRMVAKFGAFGRGYDLGTQADYPWCGWNMYVLAPWNNSTIPATLIEGLYHTNYDDVYNVLLSASGRDAYAQGVFEGICDYYGWSYTANKPRPFVSNNADGRLEVFARGRDSAMWHAAIKADGTGWSNWMSFGGSFKGDPTVIRNADGRMEAFCVGTDGHLYHIWQATPNSSWVSSWSDMGGSWPGNPAAAIDANGCLYVFLRGNTNNIYYKCQLTPGGSWSANWVNMDANTFCKSDPAAITANDGNIHVFAVGTGGTMLWNHQTPGWAGWSGIGKDKSGSAWPRNPVVAKNTDGRLEVFAVDSVGKMNHKWQLSDGSWNSGWDDLLGGTWTHDPVLGKQADGHIMVFCVGTTGNVYSKEQVTGGWTSSWANYSGTWAGDPGVGSNGDGRVEVFLVGNDPYMYHKWETSPNGSWTSSWATLGPNTIF